MDTCYDLSHLVFLSLTFCQAQGYPLRFLAPTQVYELPIGFSRKVPPRSLLDALLYMLLVLQLRPPLGVINLQHQSFISPNSNKNTKPAKYSHWRNKKTIHQLHIPTSSSFYTNCNNLNKNRPLLLLSNYLSDLGLIALIPISLVCLKHSQPPIIYCQHVSHNT